jgi:hypothetical protein
MRSKCRLCGDRHKIELVMKFNVEQPIKKVYSCPECVDQMPNITTKESLQRYDLKDEITFSSMVSVDSYVIKNVSPIQASEYMVSLKRDQINSFSSNLDFVKCVSFKESINMQNHSVDTQAQITVKKPATFND